MAYLTVNGKESYDSIEWHSTLDELKRRLEDTTEEISWNQLWEKVRSRQAMDRLADVMLDAAVRELVRTHARHT